MQHFEGESVPPNAGVHLPGAGVRALEAPMKHQTPSARSAAVIACLVGILLSEWGGWPPGGSARPQAVKHALWWRL